MCCVIQFEIRGSPDPLTSVRQLLQYTHQGRKTMFESAEQATAFMNSMIHYNRFCGEYVVMVAFYFEKIASFF